MSDDDTNDFVAELEKQAAEFEERAKFWESKQGTVTGLQVQVEGGVWKEVSAKELASRLRWLAKEWRDIARHVRLRGLRGSRHV